MSLRGVAVTDTYVEIDFGDPAGPWHFDFADFPPSASDNAKRQAHIREHFQALIDTRTRLRDLPDDEPAKTTDPGLPHFFWDGTGNPNTTDLVHREWEVGAGTIYDAALSPPLVVEMRYLVR